MSCDLPTILMADDDPDDRALVLDAVSESGVSAELRTVSDGEELLEYLRREKRYGPPALAPYPAFILLDLNMPRMDGRETLAILKSDPALQRIPVIVLSTSNAAEDMTQCYNLGANDYVAKPVTYEALMRVLRTVAEHWLNVVTPTPHTPDDARADTGTSAAAFVNPLNPLASTPPLRGSSTSERPLL